MKTFFSNKHFQFWLGISLVLGLSIFWKTLDFPFLINYDDGPLIINNPAVLEFDISRMFSEFVFGLYHPITTLSFAIDYLVFNGNFAAFHFVNIFLHFLNGILCYTLVLKLSNKKIVAGISLLLFIIHPMHVESVVWLSERKDLLYSFFFLLACVTYIKSCEFKGFSKWSGITFLLFVLAVLSKSAAVVFPLVIILIDLSKNQFKFPKRILKVIPYLLVSILIGYVNILAQKSAGFITDMPNYSFLDRILMACYSSVYYLLNFFVPINVSPKHFYPIMENGDLSPIYYVAPFLLLLSIFIAFKLVSKNRAFLFPIGFFILNIMLILKIIPTGNDIVSDRYSYLPYIGISMIVGLLVDRFYSSKTKNIFIGSGIIICLTLAFLSFSYTKVWENETTLWTFVINKNPNHRTGYGERGRNYHDNSNYKKALIDLNKALKLDSNSSINYNQRGLTYSAIEKPDKAFSDYSEAIFLDSNYAEAYSNRGVLLSKYDRTKEGILDINKAILLNPKDADYYNNVGIAHAQLAQWKLAEYNFKKCLALHPRHSDAKFNLNRLNKMSNEKP